MKFGQSIEYNMKYFSLKFTHKIRGGTILRLFPKKSKLGISIVSSLIQFVFIVSQAEGYRYKLKLNWKPLGFTSYKAFLRNENRS